MKHFLSDSILKVYNLSSWQKIIVGMVLGVLCGLYLDEGAVIFQPIGTTFINSIMMLVPVVVFVSIVNGVIAVSDPLKMGRVALKSIFWYVVTTMLGTILALFLAGVVFNPGKGVSIVSLKLAEGFSFPSNPSPNGFGVTDILTDLIPSNIITSFVEGNMLQIIVFALLFGIAITLTKEEGKPVAKFIGSLSTVIFKALSLVMSLAPIGVFALMAIVSGTQGTQVLLSLMGLVGLIYLCLFIVIALVYSALLIFFARVNPFPFYKKMFEAQLVAFSTTSSMASLPVNLKIAQNKLGISKSIANFVLPLGATINMNGLSTSLGVITIFAANLYGIDLTMMQMVTVVTTATIASIGCAGVPAAQIVVLPIVLGSVGIPLEIIGVLVAVNRLIDMMSTVANITGDTLTAVLVAKSEKELDINLYHGKAPHLSNDSSDLRVKEDISSQHISVN
ncbi:MAG: dicarboxylate/amino acid:cation symporter [Zetaproteobacteria bacterium]|nr:dicarboxylate/amino acid:cation symporter [Pseudobdellovibrionaceae bacterium]